MIKFKIKLIDVTERPIIIVGEKPGKTRDGSEFALCGNKTGDFVKEAIDNRKNIILTNVVNILYQGKFDHSFCLDEGILDLIELIEKHNPQKIICLGSIAQTYIFSIKKPDDCEVYCMPHPSFINRFHTSLRPDYIKTLQNELDKRIHTNQKVG